MNLSEYVLDPLTLGVLVVLIVEFVKEMGVEGNNLRLLAVGLGFALAVVFRLRELYPVIDPWVELFFFGLAGGMAACGGYRLLDDRLPKQSHG